MSISIEKKTSTCGSLLLSTHHNFKPHDVEVFFAGIKNVATHEPRPIIIDVSESSEIQLKSFSDHLIELSKELDETLTIVIIVGLDRYGELTDLKNNTGNKVVIAQDFRQAKIRARIWSEEMESDDLEKYTPHLESRFSELDFDTAFSTRAKMEKTQKTLERVSRIVDFWKKKKARFKADDQVQNHFYKVEMPVIQKLTMKYELPDNVLNETSGRKKSGKLKDTSGKENE
jgi:hypothetical protein